MEHDLKSWPEFFSALENGSKTFEIRRTDRKFTVGDTLLIREWEPGPRTYTGRELRRTVTYMHLPHERAGDDWPLNHKFCVLGVAPSNVGQAPATASDGPPQGVSGSEA